MTVLQVHEDQPAPVAAKKPAGILRSTLGTPKGRIGAILLGSVVLLAILGPWLTSVDPEELVGIPFDPPGAGFDFAAFARSFGLHAETVRETSAFAAALDRCRDRAALIHVLVDRQEISPGRRLAAGQ